MTTTPLTRAIFFDDAGSALHPLPDDVVDEPSARFARTHASWTDPGIRTEDLQVSLAGKVWKGRRQDDL